jgi:hypothetical protein
VIGFCDMYVAHHVLAPAVQPTSDMPNLARVQDHKYRKHWSFYHSGIGRLLIAVIVVRCVQLHNPFSCVLQGS